MSNNALSARRAETIAAYRKLVDEGHDQRNSDRAANPNTHMTEYRTKMDADHMLRDEERKNKVLNKPYDFAGFDKRLHEAFQIVNNW